MVGSSGGEEGLSPEEAASKLGDWRAVRLKGFGGYQRRRALTSTLRGPASGASEDRR